MSAATLPAPVSAATVPPPQGPPTYGGPWAYRLSVAQYQRMAAAGILTPEDRVELLEGVLVAKMPRNVPHDGTIEFASDAFGAATPPGWRLRVQLTLVVGGSQLEPDFALVRGDRRTYQTRHPTAADAGLVVEVSDTSLARDRGDKARIYAAGGVPAYWIVNLVDRQVEVFTDPDPAASPPVYRSAAVYRPGDAVPLNLDGAAVAAVPVADLIP